MPYNELSGGNAVNLILAKRFEIGNAPAPYMASELFPGITLESDRPEWYFLGGARLMQAAVTDPAAPGNFSTCVIYNPAGSNVLAVLQGFDIVNEDAATARPFQAGYGTTAQVSDNPVGGNMRDSRQGWGTGFRGTLKVGPMTSASALPVIVGEYRARISETLTYNFPMILAPGSFFGIHPKAQNVVCTVNFRWSERAAQRGELLDSK